MSKAPGFLDAMVAVVAAFMFVASPAQAQNVIEMNDRDGDGHLSPREFPGPPQGFRRMDRDSDGFLSLQEMNRAGGPRPQQRPTQVQEQPPTHSGPRRFVDTHMHLHPLGLDTAMGGGGRSRTGSDGGMDEAANLAKAADNLVTRMDRQGLAQALVVVVVPSSKGTKENAYRTLRDAVRRQPDRLRLMGGGAILGTMLLDTAPGAVTDDLKQRFHQAADKILNEGAAGFGEMISYHLCMTQRHSFKKAIPNHPLYLLLADIAAERDVPIDIHIEAVETAAPMPARLRRACDKNPAELEPTIPAF